MNSILQKLGYCLCTITGGIFCLLAAPLAPNVWLSVANIIFACLNFWAACYMYRKTRDIAKEMDEVNETRDKVIADLCSCFVTLKDILPCIRSADESNPDTDEEESLNDFINKCNGTQQ